MNSSAYPGGKERGVVARGEAAVFTPEVRQSTRRICSSEESVFGL
jgi:hypothetical protein